MNFTWAMEDNSDEFLAVLRHCEDPLVRNPRVTTEGIFIIFTNSRFQCCGAATFLGGSGSGSPSSRSRLRLWPKWVGFGSATQKIRMQYQVGNNSFCKITVHNYLWDLVTIQGGLPPPSGASLHPPGPPGVKNDDLSTFRDSLHCPADSWAVRWTNTVLHIPMALERPSGQYGG